jgi:hypothetical protein
MTVYVVCKNVDLEYHIEKIFSRSEAAEQYRDVLSKKYVEEKIQSLIAIGYKTQEATEYATRVSEYWVEEYEIE